MLILKNISYSHPNRELLFDQLSCTINDGETVALIGNNGSGKSTLLQIMAGKIMPSAGEITRTAMPYYVPQHVGQFNHMTIAQALQVDHKLHALKEILAGNVTEYNMTALNDDWAIEERCMQALEYWQLHGLDMQELMGRLSGGEKTKVFLAGIIIHDPQIILLDEPTNHMDMAGRELLYDYIAYCNKTLIVVSHDRSLLNQVRTIYELSKKGITIYGGNYDFYATQKQQEDAALANDLKSKEKALRKARETEKAATERKQKLDARGKKKQEKAGLPTISMNTFKNNAEKSSSRLKEAHAEKVDSISDEVVALRKSLPELDKMKIGFSSSNLHKGKKLIDAQQVMIQLGDFVPWKKALNFIINSGERWSIKGKNGSGKTSLIKLILGAIEPASGTMQRSGVHAIYIDQDYSLINNRLTVYEQAEQFNDGHLQEHEINIRLTRFLFTKYFWNKPCGNLSGGEKMRLMLCCLTIGSKAPDMIVLDEPTNNLDMQNIEILTNAINEYEGTLIAISHDRFFLQEIHAENVIELPGTDN